jgi:tetratricopeptide (TPR) repeat protein
MTNLIQRLAVAASATAILAGCTTGFPVPGFGDASGCRTIYVYRGGGVQPVSNCGGGGVPRDTLTAQRVTPQGFVAESEDPNAPVVTPVSAAAKATAPYDQVTYPGANEMIENADMAAFMARVRADFAKKQNAGAWGYMVVDAMAADDFVTAQAVIDAMSERPPPDILSALHLRPWLYAANGRASEAMPELLKLRRGVLPSQVMVAHRALLAEGMGDTVGALAIYADIPAELDPPGPEDAGSPDAWERQRVFNTQRQLMIRQAELLRALNRDPEAVDIYTRLAAAAPEDPYVRERLEKARKGEERPSVRTIKQAMAVAIADEADMIAEEQMLVRFMARGAKLPFNHLLSSLRQSALLLHPDNGDLRLQEASVLYQEGKFEAALRIAQIGETAPSLQAALWSTAGLAALELRSPDTLLAMTERALQIDSSPLAKLQAAGALTSASKTDRAIQLIDQAMRQGLPPDQQVAALMTKGQAHLQAGNVAGAVNEARAAQRLQDDETTKQFLASMLVEQKNQARQEGLTIMRTMLAEQPENTGLMNNFGYSLIDDYQSNEELDEGFRLLKQAIRITPDEANLLDSIGWAYYQYGDFREAKRYIGLALESYEPFAHWELSDHMGDVHWRLGEQADARKAWQHSLDSYPPAHNKAAIEAKLRDGLKTPAPVRRETPEVPLNIDRGGVSDI